jgi:Ca2+-binding EF-hand superfamily protein
MTSRLFATAVAAALVGATVPALAQEWATEPSRSVQPDIRPLRVSPSQPIPDENAFRLMDDDNDGRISPTEWRQRKMLIFYMLDLDGDGFVARGEVPLLLDDAFDVADEDKDGKISGYEFNQAPIIQFDVADTDRDGGVDKNEFSEYRRQLTGNQANRMPLSGTEVLPMGPR